MVSYVGVLSCVIYGTLIQIMLREVSVSPESPLDRHMRGMKGPTHPDAMNLKKYRRHPRTWEYALGFILGPLKDTCLQRERQLRYS